MLQRFLEGGDESLVGMELILNGLRKNVIRVSGSSGEDGGIVK
jgi:hypothetical protein